MSTRFLGVDGYHALFDVDGEGVLVNTRTFATASCDSKKEFSSRVWMATDELDGERVEAWRELAECAVDEADSKDITIMAAGNQGRLYTVPKNVANEAKFGLSLYESFGFGVTPVGHRVATTLAAGGQVDLRFARHVARYFPRHEGLKREESFQAFAFGRTPTPERIGWSMWGGDAGWRWAQTINEQTPVVSAGYGDVDLHEFVDGNEEERQFFARLTDLDSMQVDTLYSHDALSDRWYVWDDGEFVPASEPSQPDFLVELDDESALYVASSLYEAPEVSVALSLIDPLEFDLVQQALPELDWETIETVMTPAALQAAGDGYTPQERSKNASVQLRDANGRFVPMGGTGTVGTSRVKVLALDPNRHLVLVQDTATGRTWYVDPKTLSLDPANAMNPTQVPQSTPGVHILQPINLRGILAKPRATSGTPKASLKHYLPPMTAQLLQEIIANYDAVIERERRRGTVAFAEAKTDAMNPDNSDVKPIYFAIVDPSDTQSVLDLVALSPSSKTNNASMTFKRDDGQWIPAPEVLSELKSATPPPVVQLDDSTYPDVVSQVDASTSHDQGAIPPPATTPAPATPAVAASLGETLMPLWGPDGKIINLVSQGTFNSRRGQAEKLRQYWLYGEGSTKIKWSTAGALARCARYLRPFLGERAEVYASSLNGEATSVFGLMDPQNVELAPLGNAPDAIQVTDPQAGDQVTCPGCGDVVSYDDTDGFQRGDGSVSHDDGTSHSDFIVVLTQGNEQDDSDPDADGDVDDGSDQDTDSDSDPDADSDMDTEGSGLDPDAWNDEIPDVPQEGDTPGQVPDDATLSDVNDVVDNSPSADLEEEPDDNFDPEWEPHPEIQDLLRRYSGADDSTFALLAAGEGGLDRNRGNAEKLRHYWLFGPGAAKIRWNTGGDWTRCVRYLSKYLGPRAKGYCALRHHEATGMWTGDKLHREMYGRHFSLLSLDDIKPLEEINASAALVASANVARAKIAGGQTVEVDNPEDIQGDRVGATFRIPLVIPEGMESGDGRFFDKGALSMRTLPLPLLWQYQTGEGHDGSVLVGRIDRCERVGNGLGNAYGVFDTGPHGQEAERLVREGFLRWVSADLDKFQAEKVDPEDSLAEDDEDDVSQQKMRIKRGRLMGITLVPKPAFQECTIELVPDNEINVVKDGVYVSEPAPLEAAALIAAAETTMAIPLNPPSAWFENPNLTKPTALSVMDDGRVFGHIAAWDIDHIGMAFNTKPPRSRSKYAYFHTGVVRSAEGKDIPVGQITLAGGHAPIDFSAASAVKHYDDTASAVVDVHAGEDEFGIWVAGALRPSVSPEQIRALRAAAPSGDWRVIRGRLELVAVCQVNVPGFPIARAQVASGAVMALVAAGAASLARLNQDPMTQLASRVALLEKSGNSELAQKAAAARAKIDPIRKQKKEALTAAAQVAIERLNAAAEASIEEYLTLSADKRKNTMKDGSFPIPDVAHLRKAIKAYGRAGDDKKAAVRRHIISRARKLGKSDLVPSNWREAAASDLELAAQDARDIVASARAQKNDTKNPRYKGGPVDVPEELMRPFPETALAASTHAPSYRYRGFKFNSKTQPRDEAGKFLQVLARLKLDLGGSAEMQDAADKVAEAEGLGKTGDYAKAQKAAAEVLDVVDRVGSGALNPQAVTGIRESSRQLGRAMAHLPLPFGDQTQKLRYSDLPPVTHEMIDGLIARVEKRLDAKSAKQVLLILKDYMAGGHMFSQGQLQAQLSKILRVLT